MGEVTLLGVREAPLSVDEVLRAVDDPAAGGTCVFIGTVREVDGGRSVTQLDYEAHPVVEDTLRTVAEKVAADVPVCRLAAVHRVGSLRVGELAVVVAVSAAHRQEAFAACRQLIDDLKGQVPIWKHQLFGDGSDEWVGTP